ncbi:ABC transporter ATP-binding protein [Levilinea saccharolytica]|uniref:Heme ABC transporter ATP-binding protein n=1 Tax=Levilinea saccharolytica TaxID=229921 RepID=A0A0M8JPC6_9CHLR|nr:ABC transporter ATP-binding protein [Levilinea saccharolytica]KPL76199.1 heme ABC transporter ATP-binding protein [Levilinea saccharolytica]GAP19037.1 nucleoside ABC transporter ATP-binding protein [Levilinea saccharolytica]
MDQESNANLAVNVVEMRGIVKRFPGVLANDHVNFDLQKGEIHALLGENGAGKSTLMNILAGMYRPDYGTITVNGQPVNFTSPADAIRAGIGMIHQHFMLVPSQNVTENILLGLKEPRFIMNIRKYEDAVAALGERYGLKVDPRAKIWQLSVGEQQRVEILKALYRGANILIMDEPTAVLAPKEIEELFMTLRSMTKQEKSIIFISHKLHEITSISNRVTVMRKGKVTSQGISVDGVTRADLARLMVGRDVEFNIEKEPCQVGGMVLQVQNVQAMNDKGLPALRGVSLTVNSGEIVGLAGVAGNGQSELAEVIAGLRKVTGGKIFVQGEDITNQSVKRSITSGVSLVPEDRTRVGTAPNLSMTDNVIMKNYKQAPIGRGWMINAPAADDYAKRLKDTYDIMTPSTQTSVRLMSGGNLQKVILAREISSQPALMVAVQPTRGLDVGAIEGVQHLLLEQRKNCAAILLISEELEELLALSDRIYVIYEGQIMGEVTDGDIEKIGQMMLGARTEQLETAEGESNHD